MLFIGYMDSPFEEFPITVKSISRALMESSFISSKATERGIAEPRLHGAAGIYKQNPLLFFHLRTVGVSVNYCMVIVSDSAS